MNKLSIFGYLSGIFWLVTSTLRWYYFYPDTSQMVIAWGLGIAILFCSWTLQAVRDMREQVDLFESSVKKIREDILTKRLFGETKENAKD